MVGLGPMEMLILLFAIGGDNVELATIIDAEKYFQSRNLPMTIEAKLDFAGTEPKTPKAQLQQLLSLRWMTLHPKKVNQSKHKKAAWDLLAQIAAGKKANDHTGFAKEHAAIALARLQGKDPPKVNMPLAGSCRKHALQWFPTSVDLMGALDVRRIGTPSYSKELMKNPLFGLGGPAMMKQYEDKLYSWAEALGNIRLNRVSFGYDEDAINPKQSRIYLRFSGKFHHERLLAYFKSLIPALQPNIRKGIKGTRITVFQFGNQPPASAIVGDSDLIVGGFQDNNANHKQIVEEMLMIRSGRKDNVTNGPFKQELKKISKYATGLLFGNVPVAMQKTFGPNIPVPIFVRMQMYPNDKHQVLSFQGEMSNAQEANTLKKKILDGRDQAIMQLAKLPNGAPVIIPKEAVEELGKMLKSLKINSKGKTIQGTMRFDPRTLLSLPTLFLGARLGIVLPPPQVFRKAS